MTGSGDAYNRERESLSARNRPSARSKTASSSSRSARYSDSFDGEHPLGKRAQRRASATDVAHEGAFVPARTVSAPSGVGAGVSQYSRNSSNYSARNVGMSTGKKIAVAIVVIALIAAIVALGFYIMKELRKNEFNTVAHSKYDAAVMTAIDEEVTGTIEYDKPFTVLLLGSDARTGDPEMGARTDTVILVRVDTENNVVSMISIPRDTMIQIEGYGTQKFNAAYTFGGPSGTIRAVKELTGIDIDHYAEINFEGLVEMIDAIGGVDVQVDETIDDPDAGNIVIPEGLQHLDGEAALVFARSRAYADGDYTRQSNQRKIIMALAYKMLETPASELTGLIQTSASFLSMDSAMDFDFMYSVADQMRHNEKPITIYSANIPSAPAMVGDISYVIVDTAGLDAMMQDFAAGEDISSKDYTESIYSDVANAGGGYGDSTGYTYDESYNYSYDESYNYTYDESQTQYTENGEYVDPSAGQYDPNATGYNDQSGAYGDGTTGYDAGTGDAGTGDMGAATEVDAGGADAGTSDTGGTGEADMGAAAEEQPAA